MATITEYLNNKNNALSAGYNALSDSAYSDAVKKNNGGFGAGLVYIGEKTWNGLVSWAESTSDAIIGGIASLFGDYDTAKRVFSNDWRDYNAADERFNPGTGWKTAGDIFQGVGYSLPSMAIMFGTGGAASALGAGATAAKLIAGTTSFVTSAVGATGNAAKEAMQTTGKLGKDEWKYALLSGATEGAVETFSDMLFGGVGGIANKLGQQMTGKVAKAVARESAFKTIGKAFLSEGGEEIIGGLLEPVWKRMTINPDEEMAWSTPEKRQELLYQGFVGGMSGALMGGAGQVYSSAIAYRAGSKTITAGKAQEVLDTAKAAVESTSDSKVRDNIRETLDLYNKEAEKSGNTPSMRQAMLLGELEGTLTQYAFEDTVRESAIKIMQNPEAVVEAVNAWGIKDDSGEPIVITAEQIRENSGKNWLKENSLLQRLAILDAAGRLMADTNTYEQALLEGQYLGTHADVANFVQKATPEQKAAVNAELGIDIEKATYEEISKAFSDYLYSGRNEQFAQRVADETELRNAPAMDAIDLDSKFALKDGETATYNTENGTVRMSARGDTVYAQDSDGKIRSTTREEAEKFAQDNEKARDERTAYEKYDARANEEVSDYKNLSEPRKVAIREILRQAEAKGVDAKTATLYAKIAARTGLDVTFDEKFTEDGMFDGTNRIVVNPKGSHTRTFSKILIHELDHALTKYSGAKLQSKLIKTAFENMSEDLRLEVAEKYKNFYENNTNLSLSQIVDIINDEETAAYAEQMLTDIGVWDYLLSEKPTLKQKVLSFFTGEAQAYKGTEMSKEARRWWRLYKKAFDTISAKKASIANAGNAVQTEERYSVSNEKRYSYESLSKKQDMEITVLDKKVPVLENGKINRSLVKMMALANVRKQKNRLNTDSFVYAHCDDANADIRVGTNGISHGLDRRVEINAKAALVIGDLIKNAIRVNEVVNDNGNSSSDYVLFSAFQDDGNLYGVSIYVNRVTNTVSGFDSVDIMYSENGKKIGTAAPNAGRIGESQANPTVPTISIAQLLEKSNKVFKDIFSKDVYAHFGTEKDTSTKLGSTTRYALSETDSEYLDLAKDPAKNEAKLRKMVEDTARKAGYDSPILYHGTDKFGFTTFDLSKMDDRRSIFLTDSERIASTYSGAAGERKISETANIPDNISPVILASELNANMTDQEKKADYSYMSFTKKAVDNLVKENKIDLFRIKDFLQTVKLDFSKEHYRGAFEKLKSELGKPYDPRNNDISTPLYMLTEHAGIFEDQKELRAKQVESNVRLANKLLSFFDNSKDSDSIAKIGMGGYDIEILSIDEAKEELKKNSMRGNYSLVAKTENLLSIDAGGSLWREIPVPKELSEDLYVYTLSRNKNSLAFAEDPKKTRNTRELAEYASERGYSGVKIKNVSDNGGRNAFVAMNEKANVYIYFSPNQIKSADPVTYDGNGNVIPLSERFNPSNPDIRYALPEMDSDGKALSENQRQYFSETKVKAADGRLLAVYHGSNAKFNEFSYDFMSRNGSSEGQGFYFTDKKEMAEGYKKDGGQLLHGYLNITNPLSDSKKTLKRKEVERLLRAVDPTGDDVIINYDNSGIGYPSKSWYARALSEAVSSIYEYADTDSEILGEIANSGASSETVLTTAKRVLGYDGYIVKGKYEGANVYVAFTSEQFKNADNKNPTSSKDVRFALSEEDKIIEDVFSEKENKVFDYEKIEKIGLPMPETDSKAGKQKVSIASVKNILDELTDFKLIAKKQKDMIYRSAYNVLNFSKSKTEQQSQIKKISDYITAKVFSLTNTSNYGYDDLNEIINYSKNMFGKLSFTDNDKSELKHLLDEKGLKSFLGRWNYKGGKNKFTGAPISPTALEVFVTDFARENPGMEYLESIHPAEAMLEINAIYDSAVEAMRESTLLYEGVPDSEAVKMSSEIAEKLLSFASTFNAAEKPVKKVKLQDVPELKPRSSENTYFEPSDSMTAEEVLKRTQGSIRREAAPSYKPTLKDKMKASLLNAKIAFVDEFAGVEDVGKRAGVKNIDTLIQTARSSTTRMQSAMGSFAIDYLDGNGEKTMPGFAKILAPIYAKGDQVTEDFMSYLYHYHNIDRMSLTSKSKAKLDALKTQYTALATRLKDLRTEIENKTAEKGAKTKYNALLKEAKTLKKKIDSFVIEENKPVFGENDEQGRSRSVTADESRATVERLEKKYPEFKKHAERVWRFFNNLQQYRVNTGLISAETKAYLDEKYPHYVPTVRDSNVQGIASIKGKNNIELAQTVKTAIGSGRDLKALELVAGQMLQQTYKAGATNNILNAIFDATSEKGMTDDIEIVERKKVASEEESDRDYEAEKPKDNQITFYRNGERITIKTTKEFFAGFDSMKSFSGYENPVLNFLNKAMNLFKNLVTSYNPAFTIRNKARDLQDAGINTKYGKKFAETVLSGRAEREIKNNSELWKLYCASGGFSSSVFNFDDSKIGETGERGFEKIQGFTGDTALEKIKNGVKSVKTAIENTNEIVEQTTRFAEFICAIESGKTVEQAALDAAEVTTNFGRTGNLVKHFNRTIMPFLNASIQGTSKLIRNVVDAKSIRAISSLLFKVAFLGMLPQIFNHLVYNDDDDYKELRDNDKANNFLIKVGNDFIKIPKGRVASAMAGAVEQVWHAAKGEQTDVKGYLKNTASQITPVDNVTRTLVSPLMDAANNKTWYGTAIEGKQFENTAVKDRYDEATSSIAIGLGKILNYSPKKIHYIIDQYSGVIGDFILPATTKKAERGFISGNFTIDPVSSNRLSTDFYKLYDEAQYAKTAGDETAAYQVQQLNRVKSAISEMFKQKSEIQKRTDLSGKEKLAETRTIQALINEAYRTAINDFDTYTSAIKSTDGMDEKLRGVEATRLVYGAEAAFKQYNSDVYDKMSTLAATGISYDNLYSFYFGTKDIKGDSDGKGGFKMGTKRKNIVSAINKLNVTPQQKLLLIASKGYSLVDGDVKGMTAQTEKRKLLAYINSIRGLTEDQKETLAKMCGYTYKNGRVTM